MKGLDRYIVGLRIAIRVMVAAGVVIVLFALGFMLFNLNRIDNVVAVCLPFIVAGGAIVVSGLVASSFLKSDRK